jgi:hypothetical protein
VGSNSYDDVPFIKNAFQYYATARFAAHAGFLPVSGNLFHHAIEMSLKAGLVQKRPLSELKDMGHKLKTLWRAFKMDYPATALDRHDATIAGLDKFERIRYPGTSGDSMTIQLAWSQQPPSNKTYGGMKTPEPYVVVVNHVDDVIVDVLKACSWNPAALIGMIGANPATLEAINRRNPHSQFLTDTPPV